MDISANLWDKTNIAGGADLKSMFVPTYELYGEKRHSGSDFWVHCETIAARSSAHHWEIRPHRHESFFQFLYIRTGSGDADIAGERIMLTPPCVVLMPPGVSHGYRFSRDIEGFVVTVVADRLPITSRSPQDRRGLPSGPLVTLIEDGESFYLDATVRRIAEEFDTNRGERRRFMEALLTTAILLSGSPTRPEKDVRDAKQARVEALTNLIATHFREQLTAEDYARHLNLSVTHLNRVVREVTGQTVHDLVMTRVVDEASRALVFTPTSVKQIAGSLGFSDPGYFSRWFRKRTGRTPAQFRSEERARLDR